MKRIAILIGLIVTISCSKNKGIEQSFGTKLTSIEYQSNDKNWTENYTYSSNGELNMVENFYSLGKRYEITYQNDKWQQYTTYQIEEDRLIFRDSFLYNSDGTIQAIYNFSRNSGDDLPLSWIYEYEYNTEGKVFKKSTYFVTIEAYVSIEKYYWKGDNIERAAYYNADGELYYEYFYEYDDKVNYRKKLAINAADPINWSENNVVKIKWKDYAGNLDLICSPCEATYKYNLDNYPVEITNNWGRTLKLTYE